MKRTLLAAGLLASWVAASAAQANDFALTGDDLAAAEETTLEVDGALRLRSEALVNLDLDAGRTPSGQAYFPVPIANPDGQVLTHADMRLRGDLAFYAPAGGLAVKMRVDVLDNIALGSLPNGVPQGATTQRPPAGAFRIKRAWGEALTPVGLLAAGRMGSHWGLGMLSHGGDCADCDGGDGADRIAFATPLFGHIWAAAYDFAAIGPVTSRQAPGRSLDFEPSDDVRTVTFAALRYHAESARERRRRAGKTTVEYGAYVSYRWQDNDIPATYLPSAPPAGVGPSDVVRRDYAATAFDGWFRLTAPWLRVELEGAVLLGEIGQASLVPGVELRDSLTTTAWGFALETDLGANDAPWQGGLDLGVASSDDAPGFGAFPGPSDAAPVPGDLRGPQALPPRDTTVDNFSFHPDYRVDRILFREIIGTVTGALYVRPHVRWRILDLGPSTLTLALSATASWALDAQSTPGGEQALGVELDPTLVYAHADGFQAALEHAVLFPLAGLDNPLAGLEAQLAQVVRLRLGFGF